MSAPDTVIVMFQSNRWQDSLLTSIGSDLKVDDVHFRSQLTLATQKLEGNDEWSLVPNPATSELRITNEGLKIDGVKIYNVLG